MNVAFLLPQSTIAACTIAGWQLLARPASSTTVFAASPCAAGGPSPRRRATCATRSSRSVRPPSSSTRCISAASGGGSNPSQHVQSAAINIGERLAEQETLSSPRMPI